MEGIEIEVPDREDAACGLDTVEARLVRQGQYDAACAVIDAKRRIRLDEEEIDAHMERVAGLEAKLAQYRWRRVEDEMPEAFEGVIVAGPDRRTEAFIDEQGRWRWGGTANVIREFVPSHWMPLPAAPGEGE